MDSKKEFNKGISVIIPTHQGENFIPKLLSSLENQTLDKKLFEIIFVINGELDNTPYLIKNFIDEHPEFDIKIEYSEKGVSNARNQGIKKITKEYTLFIDDDDYVSPNYFEKLYKYSNSNRIVLGTFFDVNPETNEIKKGYFTDSLLKNKGIIENPYKNIKDAIVITSNKLIPSEAIKKVFFNPDLKNGVDISYYSKLYSENDFEFYVIDKDEKAIYYHLSREGSISKQPISYKFNILGRLKVIKDINNVYPSSKLEIKEFLESLITGQVIYMNRYLKKHPEDIEKVSKEINKNKLKFFPYKYFNEDLNNLNNQNNELIISYAFTPTNATTATVMAKRILNKKNNVDLIQGSLNNIENTNLKLEKIVSEFILNRIIINIPFSLKWENIKEFVNKSLEKLEELPVYEKIYSRSYYQHSHFLALEYKLKHPESFWSAEFSDPSIYNLEGNKQSPPIKDEKFINRINSYLDENLRKINVEDSLNFICEYLTYIFADEIIFTNKNQKEVMMDLIANDKIRDIVNKKYSIKPHPTIDEKYYFIKESDYNLDESYINFAYFGSIYPNRSLEDFINAFDNLDSIFKNKFKLHIFSQNKTMLEQVLSNELFKNTKINPNIEYLEFLNLCTKFDVLLIEDSYTKDYYNINPYLPSKIFDYKGSKSDIWAICEKNSSLDKIDVKYKSITNDFFSVKNTLNNIFLDKINLNKDDLEDESFLKLSSILFKENYKTDLNNLKNSNDITLFLKENEKLLEYLRKRNNHKNIKINQLIDIAEEEFIKDEKYLTEINSLKKENNLIKTSNSWKITKSLRLIRKKFK